MSELTTGGINFGYESPINFIMGQIEQEIKQIQNETENRIMCEIRQQLGVYVDKEELIKALRYDRNQYDKGYADGRASIIVEELENQKTGHWIPVSERLPEEMGTYMTTIDYGKHGLATGQRYYHGRDLGWADDCVIAWMPLPEPYKAESEE